MRTTVIALLALLIAAPAKAATKLNTVEDVMELCRRDNTEPATDRALCLGWVGDASAVMFELGHEPTH